MAHDTEMVMVMGRTFTSLRGLAMGMIVTAAAGTLLVAPAAQASGASTVSAKKYTITQVKKHTTSSNCWTTVNGNVYNLTGWIKQHPGGASRIIGMCGKDATRAYNAQHNNSAAASRSLAAYKIGTLA